MIITVQDTGAYVRPSSHFWHVVSLQLGQETAAQRLVAMTQSLERIFPASENVYMVVPETELELYHQEAKAQRRAWWQRRS